MPTCPVLLLSTVLIAADRPVTDLAWEMIDAALEKAWAERDPREYLCYVLGAATSIDPERALERIRVTAERLDKQKLPPKERSTYATFAELAAPLDRKLRNDLLRRASIEARRSLDDKELWKAKPVKLPEGAFHLVDPQKELDQCKEHLSLGAPLWDIVVADARSPDATLDRLKKLFADAKAMGRYGSDAPASYEFALLATLIHLDPELLIRYAAKSGKKDEVAGLCLVEAYERSLDHRRDKITGTLVAFAMENGAIDPRGFEVFKHYDLARAWALASKLPGDRNDPALPRRGALVELIVEWAWRDPDAALSLAEKEPEEDTRRELISRVAGVWVYKKPNQIERAIRNQDNEYSRNWARKEAAAELARRDKGHPPRDTRQKVAKADLPTFPTGKGHREPAEVARILDNPADTSWLKAENRTDLLWWAAATSYRETATLEGIERIVAGLTNREEIDEVLCKSANALAQWGEPAHAMELVKRIRSRHQSILTACEVVRVLGRREDLQLGDHQ